MTTAQYLAGIAASVAFLVLILWIAQYTRNK